MKITLATLAIVAGIIAIAFLRSHWRSTSSAAHRLSVEDATSQESAVKELNDSSDFKALVGNSKIPVLIDFSASWCGPCQRLGPNLEKVAREYQGKVAVYKVDVDKSPRVTRKYGVQAYPTMVIVLPSGKEIRVVGYKTVEELRNLFESALKQ